MIKQGTFWGVRDSISLDSWMLRNNWNIETKLNISIEWKLRMDRQHLFGLMPCLVWEDCIYYLVRVRRCIDMRISLTASVATTLTRRTRWHRSEIYGMIEKTLDQQHLNMTVGDAVPLWKHNAETFKRQFST